MHLYEGFTCTTARKVLMHLYELVLYDGSYDGKKGRSDESVGRGKSPASLPVKHPGFRAPHAFFLADFNNPSPFLLRVAAAFT